MVKTSRTTRTDGKPRATGTGRNAPRALHLKLAPKHRITEVQIDKFLEQLRAMPNVVEACRVAGIICTQALYALKTSDEDFSRRWDEARDIGFDMLEATAVERVRHGTPEPVFYQGVQCGVIYRYSDALMMFLLKGNKARYGDRFESTGELKIIHENAPGD